MTEPSLPEELIFGQAVEIESAEERAAYLDRACGADPALRSEVEALLRSTGLRGDLLDLPDKKVSGTLSAAERVPDTFSGLKSMTWMPVGRRIEFSKSAEVMTTGARESLR